MATTQLKPATYPNMFVRLDGTGITGSDGSWTGFGTAQQVVADEDASCTFNLIHNSDGTVSFQLAAFPNLYLRVNGDSLNSYLVMPEPPPSSTIDFGFWNWSRAHGGQGVTCGIGVGSGEKFIWDNDLAHGTITLELAEYPGIYLSVLHSPGSPDSRYPYPEGWTLNCFAGKTNPWVNFLTPVVVI